VEDHSSASARFEDAAPKCHTYDMMSSALTSRAALLALVSLHKACYALPKWRRR
jgi:hypothetical protein